MPVKISLQLRGSAERLPLRHIRPGDEPYELHDYTSGVGLVIAAACSSKNRCGEIYHVPDEQLERFPDSDGVPPELLNDANLHTTIEPGDSYERDVVMVAGQGVGVARFIFTHFK